MSQHLGHRREIQGIRNLRGTRNFQRNLNHLCISKVLNLKNSHYSHFQVSEISNYSTLLKILPRSQRAPFQKQYTNLSCLKNSKNFESLAMQFTFSTLPSSTRGNRTKLNKHTCATSFLTFSNQNTSKVLSNHNPAPKNHSNFIQTYNHSHLFKILIKLLAG